MKKVSLLVLVLKSALILEKYPELIQKINTITSPNAAYWEIRNNPPPKVHQQKAVEELARSAQSFRTISRDYPEKISELEKLFEITLR